jgi:hypothetical protein
MIQAFKNSFPNPSRRLSISSQLEEVPRIRGSGLLCQLRLHPFWNQLRGDPRFEKLVEEAKKPVALK